MPSSDGIRVDRRFVRVDDPFHKDAPLSVDKGTHLYPGLARAAIDLPVLPGLYLASLP